MTVERKSLSEVSVDLVSHAEKVRVKVDSRLCEVTAVEAGLVAVMSNCYRLGSRLGFDMDELISRAKAV